jgi:serine protease
LTENGIQKGYGYNFVSDCSNAGECPKNTPLAARKPISPKPDALDNITYPSPYWHGTTVIGVIIGQHITEEATLGGAPDALVVPVRVMGTEGYHDSDLINGMLWAAGIHPDIPNPNPAQVINMSLGGDGQCPADMQKAIDDILAKNISIVVAAGNSNKFGHPVVDPVSYPANCKGVISVAATNAYNHLANYSNVGDVTIAAPAGDSTPAMEAIYALTFTTVYKPTKLKSIEYVDCPACFQYRTASGTSIAAPLVSAAVADLLSANPKLTPAEIIKILQDSATPFASAADKCHLKPNTNKCITNNAGILNVAKALELVKENKF